MVREINYENKIINIDNYINGVHFETAIDGRYLPDQMYYDLVRLGPHDKISFQKENPHGKDTDWYPNYENYKHCKTIEEALENGALINNLFHEYVRGIWKIHSKLPREPKIPAITETIWDKLRKTFSYRADPEVVKLLRRYRLVFLPYPSLRQSPKKQLEILNEAFSQNISIEKAILTALNAGFAKRTRESKADSLAASILTKPYISHSDMLGFLRNIHWDPNISRQNVMRDGVNFVFSKNIGILPDRNHRYPSLTRKTRNMPRVFELCARYLHDNSRIPLRGTSKSKFPFTAVCLNRGYRGAPHIDGSNLGPSLIKGLGNYKNGELLEFLDVEPSKKGAQDIKDRKEENPSHIVDIRDKFHFFNGRYVHSVAPIEALNSNEQPERYSIVWFTTRKFDKASKEDLRWIKKHTGVLPTHQDMKELNDLWEDCRGIKLEPFSIANNYKCPLHRMKSSSAGKNKRHDQFRVNSVGILEKWSGKKWDPVQKAESNLKRDCICSEKNRPQNDFTGRFYSPSDGQVFENINGKTVRLKDVPCKPKFKELLVNSAQYSEGHNKPKRGSKKHQKSKRTPKEDE